MQHLKSTITILIFCFCISTSESQKQSKNNWLDSINPLNWFSSSNSDLSVNINDPSGSGGPRRRPQPFGRRVGQPSPHYGAASNNNYNRIQKLSQQQRSIDAKANMKGNEFGQEDDLMTSDMSGAGEKSKSETFARTVTEHGQVSRPTTECVCRCDCCDCCPCNGNDLYYIDK